MEEGAPAVSSDRWCMPVRRQYSYRDEFFAEATAEAVACCKWACAPAAGADDSGPASGGLEPRTATFACGLGGCSQAFTTRRAFEAHYQGAHRHKCATCSRVLPTERLLEMHIAERHDTFFRAMAARRPMFECLVEGCAERFLTDSARKNHLVALHQYPRSFSFHRVPRPLRPRRAGSSAWALGAGCAARDATPMMDVPSAEGAGDAKENASVLNASVAPSRRRRAKKKRNPAETICFFSQTAKGCNRGSKCPFIHSENVHVAQGLAAAAESCGPGGTMAGAGAVGGAMPGATSDDGMDIAVLTESVAKMHFPKQVSFGRRGRNGSARLGTSPMEARAQQHRNPYL